MSISKKAAKAITTDLDRLAQLFESAHAELQVPEKVALDFAYRCDLLSDFVEKNAALDREDKHSQDAVKTVSEGDEFHEEHKNFHELGDMVEAGGLGKAAKLAAILAELLKTAGEEEEAEEEEEEAEEEEAGKKASDDEEAEEEEADEDEEAGKKAADESDDEEDDSDDDEDEGDEEAGKSAALVALAREILRVAGDDDEEADDEEEADEDEEAGKSAAVHGYDLNE